MATVLQSPPVGSAYQLVAAPSIDSSLRRYAKRASVVRAVSSFYLVFLMGMLGVTSTLVFFELIYPGGTMFSMSDSIYAIRLVITVLNALTFIYVGALQLMVVFRFSRMHVASLLNDLLSNQPNNAIFFSYHWGDWAPQLPHDQLEHFPRRVARTVRCRWVDVEKLFPGDNIKMACSTAARCATLRIVFWTPSYEKSANCLAELAEISKDSGNAIIAFSEKHVPPASFFAQLPESSRAIIPDSVLYGDNDDVASWFLQLILYTGHLRKLLKGLPPALWLSTWSAHMDLLGVYQHENGGVCFRLQSALVEFVRSMRRAMGPLYTRQLKLAVVGLFKPRLAWYKINSAKRMAVIADDMEILPRWVDAQLLHVGICANGLTFLISIIGAVVHLMWPNAKAGIILTGYIFLTLAVFCFTMIVLMATTEVPWGTDVNPAFALTSVLRFLEKSCTAPPPWVNPSKLSSHTKSVAVDLGSVEVLNDVPIAVDGPLLFDDVSLIMYGSDANIPERIVTAANLLRIKTRHFFQSEEVHWEGLVLGHHNVVVFVDVQLPLHRIVGAIDFVEAHPEFENRFMFWCRSRYSELSADVQARTSSLLIHAGGFPLLTTLVVPWFRIAYTRGNGMPIDFGAASPRTDVVDMLCRMGFPARLAICSIVISDFFTRFVLGFTATDVLPRVLQEL